MDRNRSLSLREKLALYGLCRFPNDPDIQIANRLGMPQPTFSNIQRRLRDQGYYRTVGLADLQSLGLEMITVIYGSYNHLSVHGERKKVEDVLLKKYPEIFYQIRGVHNVILFLVSKDFMEMNSVIDEIESEYVEHKIIENEGLTKVNFTLPMTLIPRFFDHSKILYMKFELEGKVDTELEVPLTKAPQKRSLAKLTKSETNVLLFLLDNPDASDVTISKDLNISRTTVSRARKGLMDSGLYRKLVIPDLGRVGFEVLGFSDTKFNPETTYRQRISSTRWLLEKLPVVMSMATNNEAVTLYSFASYYGFQKMKKDALVEYRKKKYIKGDPIILVFSFEEIVDPEPPNFAPIVRKVLDQ